MNLLSAEDGAGGSRSSSPSSVQSSHAFGGIDAPDGGDLGEVLALADAVMSDRDVAISAFMRLAEAGHSGASAFPLPPLWPMVSAAAAAQPYTMTPSYCAKLLQRYGRELTEIEVFTATDGEAAQKIFGAMAAAAATMGALSSVRSVRSPRYEIDATIPLPALERLWCPRLYSHEYPYPQLQITGLAVLELDKFAYTTLSRATLTTVQLRCSQPSTLTTFLNSSPNVTELGLQDVRDQALLAAIATSTVAPQLKLLDVDVRAGRRRMDLSDLMRATPQLETFVCGAVDHNVNDIVNALPVLRHLHMRCFRSRLTDLSFVSRLESLVLDWDNEGRDAAPVNEKVIKWHTLPTVVALRHLRLNGSSPATAMLASRLVHRGLQTLDVNLQDVTSVCDALLLHLPELRVLSLAGEGTPDLALLLTRCGRELRKLNLRLPFVYSSPDDMFDQRELDPRATQGWKAVAATCTKLEVFHTNFLCDADGLGLMTLLASCRRLESVLFWTRWRLKKRVRRALYGMTIRRRLALYVYRFHRRENSICIAQEVMLDGRRTDYVAMPRWIHLDLSFRNEQAAVTGLQRPSTH